MTPNDTDQRIQTVCLFILATVAVAFMLYWLRSVMVPFVLAVFLALGLSPLVDLQVRRRVPQTIAVIVTLIVGVAILVLVGALVTNSATRLASNAGQYQEQVRDLFDRAVQALPLERFGISPAEVDRLPFNAISTLAVGITNAIIELVSKGFLVLIFLGFLMIGGSRTEARVGGTWSEVERRIKRYIVFKTAISAITGVLVGAVLAFLGVELAMAFGLLAFLLNFVPSIGSTIATLLPLPVVLVSPTISAPVAVLAILIPGAIQIVIGNVVEPMVMGGGLDLHPVTVLLSLMVWGTLWGIVGMLLAVPMTAVMKILCERMELTRPVAELFAGRLDKLRQV